MSEEVEKKEEVDEVNAADKVNDETVSEVKAEAEDKKEEPAAEVKEEPKKEKSEPSGKHAELIKEIEKMSVLELSELVKTLEDRFGVSASAPAMMMSAPAGGTGAAMGEAIEEKSSFTVILAAAGDQKIAVIKAIREIKPDLGLVDAKTLVESAPKEVLKDAKKEDAETAKAKLEAAGAKVELK